MDYQITAKPADEVLTSDGDTKIVSDENIEMNSSETIANDPILEEDNVLNVKNNSSQQINTSPSMMTDTDTNKPNNNTVLQKEKKDKIIVDEIRPSSNITEMIEGDKKEETVVDSALSRNRHSALNRRPSEVSVLEKDFNKKVENKFSNSLDNTASVLLKVQENDAIQTDLIRTNVYYIRKLYDEINDLKRTLKMQVYIKMGISFVFLGITIYSVYRGMDILANLTEGGLNGLLAKFTGMNGLNSLSPEKLSGDLFGNIMNIVGGGEGTGSVEGIVGNSSSLGSEASSIEGVDLKGIDMNSIQSILDKFLK